jgi:hypothetical protein
MKRSQVYTVAGIMIALTLGVALAYPLVADMPTLAKSDVDLAVVYTYVSAPISDSNVTGLYRNTSDGWQRENLIFSYMIVMNVTNNSDQTLRITSLRALLGPDISVANSDGDSITARNLIVNDYREEAFPVGFNYIWQPHEFRLVSLSGMTGIPSLFYEALNSSVWVLGGVEAVDYTGGGTGKAMDLRQVSLQQTVQGNYLYNSILEDNQMLTLYGLEAYIVPRTLD